MTNIIIEKIRSLEGRGNLRAFVDLQIGQTRFRSFRIIQQPRQRAWVAPPQEAWTGKDGKTRYTALIEFPEWLREQIAEEVLRAWGGRQ